MTSVSHPNDLADGGAPAPRRLKCYLGPLAGERLALAPGETELLVPLPGDPEAPPRVAVYRVQRRRRARGAAFDVLVYVGNRRAAGPHALPRPDRRPLGAVDEARARESA